MALRSASRLAAWRGDKLRLYGATRYARCRIARVARSCCEVSVSVGVSVVNMEHMGASTAGVLSEEIAGVVIVGELACMVAG